MCKNDFVTYISKTKDLHKIWKHTQFLTLKSAGINDREKPEKHN
jgi:hypothetical protein